MTMGAKRALMQASGAPSASGTASRGGARSPGWSRSCGASCDLHEIPEVVDDSTPVRVGHAEPDHEAAPVAAVALLAHRVDGDIGAVHDVSGERVAHGCSPLAAR